MAEFNNYAYFRITSNKKGTAVIVEDASDVDVAEIVRCSDCVWFREPYYCLNLELYGFEGEDYCSHAERRQK